MPRKTDDNEQTPRAPRPPPTGGRLGHVSDVTRDLETAEVAPSSVASVLKARADLIALVHYTAGAVALDRLPRQGDVSPGLAQAVDLVRRGVSAPRAARLCGLGEGRLGVVLAPEERAAMERAEELRKADLEIALFSRGLFDSAAGAVASLKAWDEMLEELAPTVRGPGRKTLDEIVLDGELRDLVEKRYGKPLGAQKDATVQ